MKGLANDTASYSLRELRSQKLDATWCLGCGQGNARQQVLCRIASASRCPSRGYGEVSGTVYSSEATPRAASFKLSLDSELLGKPTNHRIRRLWAVGITQLSEPNKLNCEFEPSDLRPTLEFDTVTTPLWNLPLDTKWPEPQHASFHMKLVGFSWNRGTLIFADEAYTKKNLSFLSRAVNGPVRQQ